MKFSSKFEEKKKKQWKLINFLPFKNIFLFVIFLFQQKKLKLFLLIQNTKWPKKKYSDFFFEKNLQKKKIKFKKLQKKVSNVFYTKKSQLVDFWELWIYPILDY